jgi:hypothetical protein
VKQKYRSTEIEIVNDLYITGIICGWRGKGRGGRGRGRGWSSLQGSIAIRWFFRRGKLDES